MITVSGVTSEISINGRTPLATVNVGGYREGDSTPVVSTVSDSAGVYSLRITTNGMAIGGYLLGRKTGYKDTYLYPPAPLVADTPNVPVLMLTQSTFDLAATFAGASQSPGTAFIGIQLFDAARQPVAGATVTSTPAGMVRYNQNGLPNRNATATATDGIAYIFSVAPGNVTVSANGSGITFRSHTINARADQVTTTIVEP